MGSIIRFGSFEADLDAGQLLRRGVKVVLPPQSFQVLAILLDHPGQVVTREELQHRLWEDGVFVDFQNNLNTAISRVREALADSAGHPRFIETLPKHGYRFIGKVAVRQNPKAAQSSSRKRLLVLPFLNLTGNPALDFVSDAITDEIITLLAGLSPDRIAVIARGTSLHFRNDRRALQDIRREVGVDFFVEGSVQPSADGLCVNVQLIQGEDLTHLFAGRFQGEMRELFNLQGRMARAIAPHLPIPADVYCEEAIDPVPLPDASLQHLAAYREYIQARDPALMATANPEHLGIAKRHLENAIELDPNFAQAHDSLAELYWYLGYFGLVQPRIAFSQGIVHALRALHIDDKRAETHALLGQFHKLAEYNWRDVHREMALALRIDPHSSVVRMRYAVSDLMPQGLLGDAIRELQHAIEYDPLFVFPRFWLAIVLVLSRRYDQALEEGQRMLELSPTSCLANFVLSLCHRYLGHAADAVELQRRAVELSGGSAAMLGWLGLTLAGSGELGEAKDVLDRLHLMAGKSYVPPTSFAWILLGLKKIDAAFEWLDRAVDECDQLLMPIKSYGFFDPIRSDQRFRALLHKMNLE